MSVAERDLLYAKLRELPDTMPPPRVWERIEQQARAEGLLSGGAVSRGARWFAGAGIAAAVMLAVLILPNGPVVDAPLPQGKTVPDFADIEMTGDFSTLSALMVESQQLERDLRRLPSQPRVVRASMEATISTLEDRIAAIDYRLNYPAIRLTPRQAEIYWRERVRLMNLLVNLRYAQARRMAF